MDLEDRLGGVRTWLDDLTTPIASALLYIPPLLTQYQEETTQLSDGLKFGLAGLLIWNLISHVRTYRHISRAVKEKGWSREMFRGYVGRMNASRYARHSPERFRAYERFRSENFRVRGEKRDT